jgi:hypothetical protein
MEHGRVIAQGETQEILALYAERKGKSLHGGWASS